MFKSMLVASVLLAAWPSQNQDDQWGQEVERAARTYRIHVYNSFRTNRPEFDRLQAVGAKALDAWKGEGRQPAQAQQVVDWFAKATSATGAGLTAVPQVPEFVASWQPLERNLPPQGATVPDPAQVTEQPLPQWGGSPSDPTQPNDDTPNENSETSIVRGLGRALLRTVGVGGYNHVAPPANQPELSSPLGDGTAGTPAFGPDTSAPEAETNTVENTVETPQVDLDDLKARIDGFNPAMSIVNQILQSDDPISTEQMITLVDELETLVQNYTDLQPYLALDSLSEADRSYVGQLVSPANAVDQLRKRIEEASADLELTPDSPDNDAARDELSLLGDLLLRVNHLELGPQS